MHPARLRPFLVACLAILLAALSQTAGASILCVNPSGSHSCYAKIQLAVNAASNNDVINVAPGIYYEGVIIGKPLSLIGAGAGFTVQNALYEGVLVLNTSAATIRDNSVLTNDKEGPVFGSGPACNGQPP